jgi:RND family efflux transporter MFP subunit
MKRLLRRLATLLVIAGVAIALYYLGGKYLWPPADVNTIQTVGIIEAPEVNLTSRIAGRITQLDLLEGDHVQMGQVVCRIEDIDIRNQLAKAQGTLLNALADLRDAELTVARNRELFSRGVISAQARDDSVAQVERSRATVVADRADVQLYTDQLADTVIRAPISGIVVNKALEVGEWVTPGTPILTVDDMSTIWARVDVEETDLGAIRVGDPAQVALTTRPPQTYTGRVMAIGQEGQFATESDVRRGRQDIRTFYVKVRVLQAGNDLKPGMTAEVSFSRRNGTQLGSNSGARAD